MTDAAALLSSERAFVTAPAGCGKTQLIAQAVRLDAKRRSLILTHTHAGVDALHKRIKQLGAIASTYEVNTIAGWSLRLASSFPQTSGILTQRPKNEQWDEVYASAANLLGIEGIRRIVRASFGSIYVDEYQDCSPLQHEIVLMLADILPTRILGDPMQGIFDFGPSEIVDWETHVESNFEELSPLTVPYRWIEKNPELGEWLQTVREQLELGHCVDLRQAPSGSVNFMQLPSNKSQLGNMQREHCWQARSQEGETFLAIHSWEGQCHNLARQTGGKFRSPETIECEELFKTARILDNSPDSPALARATYEFACLCLTKVKTGLGQTQERIFDGRRLQNRQYKHQEQLNALAEIVDEGSLVSVRKALLSLACTPEAVKARHELFHEMLRALKEYETGQHDSLEEAATQIRDRTRRSGRSPGRYVISRTLLVKGLEFDHVLILNVNDLDRKNLYVALTRGSRSLTILGTSPVLDPQ